MKYFIALISAFIIISITSVLSVSAAGTITLNEDSSQIASQFVSIQGTVNNALGMPSAYYVEFGIDLPGYNEKRYLKIFFQDQCTFNLPSAFPINGASETPVTPIQYGSASNVRGTWNNPTLQTTFSTINSTIINVTVPSVFYILDQTVPIYFNGNTYNPPENIQGDSFFVTKDGYTCNFGVYAGPGSNTAFAGGDVTSIEYYETSRYQVEISFTANNTNYSYFVKSYMNWIYKSNVYISADTLSGDNSNLLEYIPKQIWYTEPVYVNDYMQGIRCYISEQPTFITIPSFEEMTDYRSFNCITLNQLLAALQTNYSSLTINDLYTELKFTFYTLNGTKAYEAINDYSSLHNSGITPVDDPEVLDQTQESNILNQYITSNNNYLKWLKYGDTFTDPGFVGKTKNIDLTGLDTISIPDYTYQVETLDSEPMSFFGRLVEWFYSTPFSLIAVVSLTFLVIRSIMW